jgi:uncharacterized protein
MRIILDVTYDSANTTPTAKVILSGSRYRLAIEIMECSGEIRTVTVSMEEARRAIEAFSNE